MGDSIMGYHQREQTPMNQKKDMLNVIIDVFTITGQQTNTKTQSFLMKTPHKIGKYSFYAPNEIFESISHSWEEHDSILGRVGQIITDVGQGTKEVGEGLGGYAAGGTSFKLDAPLVWKNSPRREYSLPITLMDQDNPDKIAKVVQEFKKMSSAKANNNMLSAVDFPYVFRVRLLPGSLIVVESAALTGIQSTYHHPFIKGYPTKIDLQLTFLDLQPLFEHSFDAELGARVTTRNPR